MRAPTALIADDEPALARFLAEQLRTLWPELELLPLARNGIEATQRISELAPDVAFLDIRMPGRTGLEVAQGIEGTTRVVFVTAYDEFAVQAFEQEALDYLLKPVGRERLQQTVARLKAALAASPDAAAGDDGQLSRTLHQLQSRPAPGAGESAPAAAPLRWIRASAGDTTYQIAVDDVLCFEADEKYTVVHTAGREHIIRMAIAELAQRLDGEQFWQVHRSTLINVDKLHATRRDDASRLWLKLHGTDKEWPVSRAYVHLFKAM
ncbi:LytR/AlgR family response regulator transcription factor [Ideonella margarita]|uniref:LytTR family DNA-binding domain-containing protein n=1 Tax=Ideonella margarita TaxID=2984191 RepID=A0ABU9C890_9BURK